MRDILQQQKSGNIVFSQPCFKSKILKTFFPIWGQELGRKDEKRRKLSREKLPSAESNPSGLIEIVLSLSCTLFPPPHLCSYMNTWASSLNPEWKKRTPHPEKCLYKFQGAVGRKLAQHLPLCGWPGPWSAARRFRTCTSWGSPTVPLLAHPDKAVKLSIKAWTGWEALTGDSSHWARGSGPAEGITNTNPSETAVNCGTIKLTVLDVQAMANPPGVPFQVSCF